jgi:hypothetical protein
MSDTDIYAAVEQAHRSGGRRAAANAETPARIGPCDLFARVSPCDGPTRPAAGSLAGCVQHHRGG